MKFTLNWLVLVVLGMAGCGYRAKLDFAQADHQQFETGETRGHMASQQQLKLEVAADLDRELPRPTEFAVAAAKKPSTEQPDGNPLAVNVFIGGIHYHGDVVIEPERPVLVPQPIKATKQRDERSERLRREHEERLTEWLKKFN